MHCLRLAAAVAAASLTAQTPEQVPAQDRIKVEVERVKPEAGKPAPPLTPEEAAKVVITIGARKITAGEYLAFAETLPAQYREFARSSNRAAFAENIIKIFLLAEEARRQKLDQQPKAQAQIDFQLNSTLANRFWEDTVNKVTVDEAVLKDFYEAHRSEYERIKTRHILVRFKDSPVPLQAGKADLTTDEALTKIQKIRERLINGEDFAKTAQAESDDPNSVANGGDLGYMLRREMLPEFAEVALALQPGKLSEPVKTSYGYHLIQVERKESKTLEELRPELEKRMRPQLADKVFRQLFEKVPVSVDENFFGQGTVSLVNPPPAKAAK